MTHEELHARIEELESLITAGTDYHLAEMQAREILAQQDVNPELRIRALIVLTQSLWRRGFAQVGLSFAEEAVALSEQAERNDLTAIALGNIGLVYSNLSEYPKALEYFIRSLALFEELGNKGGMARHTGNIGSVYSSLSEYSKALEYYTRALGLYQELGNQKGVAITTGNIGSVYNSLSEYALALEYYTRALGLNEELGNWNGVAFWTSNIGTLYRELSEYVKALEYYSHALEIDEKFGNKQGVSKHYGNIGNVYLSLFENDMALEYFGRSLTIDEELGNKIGVAANNSYIGVVYGNLSDNIKALEYFQIARSQYEAIGYKSNAALLTGNIGLVYMNLSDYEKAFECFTSALVILQDLGNKHSAAKNLGNLGNLFANEKYEGYNDEKAEEYLINALTMFEEIGSKKEQYELHKPLADIYKKRKRWEKFSYHIEKYIEIRDEVQTEKARKEAGMIEQRRLAAERDKDVAIVKAAAEAKLNTTTQLLHKVLPESIATRMVNGETQIADFFSSVSILFADIVGFTPLSADMSAAIVVQLLNYIFSDFDRIMKKHGCEKIKTIGDGYMAVCGAPIECTDHAERIATAALEMQQTIHLPDYIRAYLPENTKFGIRVGLHTGSVTAGVIGEERFVWDIYSDAVNTAARMESHGEADKIHVSEEFAQHLTRTLSVRKGYSLNSTIFPFGDGFDAVLTERGEIEIKGKGMMKTYFLERLDGNG